jgi:ferredoxin
VVVTRVLACSCNGTVDIDSAIRQQQGDALLGGAALGIGELCRRDFRHFTEALEGTDDVLVTCTQESALFNEIAQARSAVAPIRFVNVRERAGWGREGAAAGPKIAALVAMASAAQAPEVPAITFSSAGRLLVIGDASEAIEWAEQLTDALAVTVLASSTRGARLPVDRRFPVLSGDGVEVSGWLGNFSVSWQVANPIDLDACVRCGACVQACPEAAIGADLQVDLNVCTGHRACVSACGSVGAIDFSRTERERHEAFDLILDLRAEPAFVQHDPPLGYFFPGPKTQARIKAGLELVRFTGEFDKPRFFRYQERLCAHSRNRIEGCRQCIDVCSTGAIAADGDRIRVEPHLCLGCGGCATVCPSGALTHAYPSPVEIGRRLRIGLKAFRDAGGRDALVLFHDGGRGREWLDALGREPGSALRGGPAAAGAGRARGLPARVIALEVHHIASIGLDLALSALALGAAQVRVLSTTHEAASYRRALDEQFALGSQLVASLGFAADALAVVAAADPSELDSALRATQPTAAVDVAAGFALSDEKRRSIEFALDHLRSHRPEGAPALPDSMPLAAGSPFGSLIVDAQRCTLCKACVGSCPEAALLDDANEPALRFIERNCVQCGLCVKTCPEQAITMQPRYRYDSQAARQIEVLHRAEPFHCVSCGKPFGNLAMVRTMIDRMAGHSMFGGEGTRRLQMCADCRVVDMFTARDELSIHQVARDGDRS